MPATINTNVMSLNAQRNLSTSESSLSRSIQRLSSGLRVNSAKDDAAGLAIADRMHTQIRGMAVAIRNANDAISMAQTAEGAMSTLTENLQRMRELAIQAMNATVSSGANSDGSKLDAEYQQLGDEVDRVLSGTSFNGVSVLNLTADQLFQVGAGTAATDRITISSSVVTVSGITANTSGNISGGTAAASAAITAIDAALNTINTARANWGAVQSRFEATVSNLRVFGENLSASRGRIMDADYAEETANLSRAQILQQAGTAMLAQANAVPQSVLTLLQG